MRGDDLGRLVGLAFKSDRVQAYVQGLGLGHVEDDEHLGEAWHEFPDAGVVFVVTHYTGLVQTVFLDAPGPRSPLGFRGELPLGVFFSMRRGELRRHLGAPHFKQTRGRMRFDAWEQDAYVLNVHYRPDDSIAFVAFLPLDD
jgi:hypothetical protein